MRDLVTDIIRLYPKLVPTTGTIPILSSHDASYLLFTGAGATTVESISYGARGKVLKLLNLTGSTLTLKHNTGSVAKHRIILSTGTDLVLTANQVITLIYDHVNSRWKVEGGSAGGGSTETTRQFIYTSTPTNTNEYSNFATLHAAAQASGLACEIILKESLTISTGNNWNFNNMTFLGGGPGIQFIIEDSDGAVASFELTAGSATPGDYFEHYVSLYDDEDALSYIWFDSTGADPEPPAIIGASEPKVRVDVSAIASADDVATAIAAAVTGDAYLNARFTSTPTAAVVAFVLNIKGVSTIPVSSTANIVVGSFVAGVLGTTLHPATTLHTQNLTFLFKDYTSARAWKPTAGIFFLESVPKGNNILSTADSTGCTVPPIRIDASNSLAVAQGGAVTAFNISDNPMLEINGGTVQLFPGESLFGFGSGANIIGTTGVVYLRMGLFFPGTVRSLFTLGSFSGTLLKDPAVRLELQDLSGIAPLQDTGALLVDRGDGNFESQYPDNFLGVGRGVLAYADANVNIATLDSSVTIDSQALPVGAKVYLGAQTSPIENGVYIIGNTGPATRDPQFVIGNIYKVLGGTTHQGKWIKNTNLLPFTLNTDPVTQEVTSLTSGGGSAYFADAGGAPSTAPTATGTDAVAIGDGASAEGLNGFAIGTDARVLVGTNNAIVIGTGAIAGYDGPYQNASHNSIVIGLNAKASHVYTPYQYDISNCIAIGNNADVQKSYGIAIGVNTIARQAGVAIGQSANAGSSSDGIAIGRSTAATNGSIAVGPTASAVGGNGIAIGRGTIAAGANSVAMGNAAYVKSASTDSIAIGIAQVGTATQVASQSVAIGSNATVRNVSGTLLRGIAIGRTASVAGNDGVAIGTEASAGAAAAVQNVAIGYRTRVTADRGVAIGIGNTAAGAQGSSSVAIGHQATASGAQGVALGYATNAQSDAVAIGRGSTAVTNSVAIGRLANAGSAGYNVAIGRGASATGASGIAIGRAAINPSSAGIVIGHDATAHASATNGVAIGRYATLGGSGGSGSRSIAIGQSATAISQYGVAIGANTLIANSVSLNNIAIGRLAQVGHTSYYTQNSIALGFESKAFSTTVVIAGAMALGRLARAAQTNAIAVGTDAESLVENAIQVQATSLLRKDSGAVLQSTNQAFRWMAGNEAIVMTKEVDLAATSTTTLTVPAGARFYPTEVGIIFSSGVIATNPDISFGITGNDTKLLAATTTTLANIFDRNTFASLTKGGEATLTATIAVAGTGTAPRGRFFFKGILIENQ